MTVELDLIPGFPTVIPVEVAQFIKGDTGEQGPPGVPPAEFAEMVAKLATIEEGATENSTDATLLDRANHTGTQAISTVTGLQGALDQKVDIDVLAAEDGTDGIGAGDVALTAFLPGGFVSSSKYGVPESPAEGSVELTQLIASGHKIYVDRNITINRSLALRDGLVMVTAPGVKIELIADANYVQTISGTAFNQAIIALPSGLQQCSVYLKLNIEFRNSVEGKPHTPMRFIGLKDSVIDLNCECWGSGDVSQTNLPDFYFWNNNVKILGNYTVHQRIPGVSLGGLWIRDIFLGSDVTRISTNVVADGINVFNDGADEALAIFVTSTGGKFKACGIQNSVIRGRRTALSVIDLTSAGEQEACNTNAFARNTVVQIDNLGPGKGAVEFLRTDAVFDGVQVEIYGVDDVTVGEVFCAAFRNAGLRVDKLMPKLINCTAHLLLTGAQPTRQIRAYDGDMHVLNCDYIAPNTAKFNHGVIAAGAAVVIGGRHNGALLFDIANVQVAANCTPTLYTGITFSHMRNTKGRSLTVPVDASGNFQIAHGMNAAPNFVSLQLVNLPQYFVHPRGTSDQNFIQGRLYDGITRLAVPSTTIDVYWEAKQ